MSRKPSAIRIEGDTAFVALSNGLESIIDAEDVANVAGRRWYADRRRSGLIYGRSAEWVGGKAKMIGLHNLIFGPAPCIDHINGNGLDNRRSNLRAATYSDNARNARLRSDNTTGLKGVKRNGSRWHGQIRVGAKRLHLGSFETPEEAHAAYCKAAVQHFGEFANFGG